MSGLTLYEIAAEYVAAATALAELDLPDDVVRDTLEGMTGDLEVKSTNIVRMARNWEEFAASCKRAEMKLEAKRKVFENRAASARDYVLKGMIYAGVKKIESPEVSLNVRLNPKRVVVFDERQVPERFLVQPEPPPRAVDKVAVKNALEGGEEVPGCLIEQTSRLAVR